MQKLVLGLDVGGTASLAVVTTLDGEVVGSGAAGAGNPLAVAPERAAGNVASALGEALAGTAPDRIAAAVLGMAGVSGIADADTASVFDRVWDEAGLRCPVLAVGDAVTAFAAGTEHPRGTVLIAGTGAVAAEVDGRRLGRVVDGLGWLLGDRGSGFWIGRRAAAVTAADLQLDRRTVLTRRIAAAVAGSEAVDAEAFTTAVYRRPPRSMAELAPLVTEAAASGDAGAAAILDRAAAHLAEAAAAVREPGRTDPIVLSGSVLRHSGPVREGVRHRLGEAWPEAAIGEGGPAQFGAARIAADLARRESNT